MATGTAAVLANAQPLLILLPAWWLYGEVVSARTATALVVGFAGLVVVALPGGGGSGAALSLLAAAAVTAGTLLSRRLSGIDVLAATGWHLLIGGLALAVFAMLVEGAFPALPVAVIVVIAVGVTVAIGAGLRALPGRLRPAVMREPTKASEIAAPTVAVEGAKTGSTETR